MSSSLNMAEENFLSFLWTCKKEKWVEFWTKSTYKMQKDMIQTAKKTKDIQDIQYLQKLFKALDIETIYHAKIIHR